MDDLSKIGERLTEAMLESNISSIMLAELVGVTVQTVNCWKRGETLLKLSNLITIANILNCTIDFFGWAKRKNVGFYPSKLPTFLRAITFYYGRAQYFVV